MKLSENVKPISYLKSHAAEVIRTLEDRDALVITLHGEAKAVMQDIKSYEKTQETMALLKMLALGNQQISEGKVSSTDDAFNRLRSRLESE